MTGHKILKKLLNSKSIQNMGFLVRKYVYHLATLPRTYYNPSSDTCKLKLSLN
jgi:hypothetical protein